MLLKFPLNRNPRRSKPPGVPDVWGGQLLRCSSFLFFPHAQGEMTNKRLKSIAINGGGGRSVKDSFIHLFIGLSIKQSLSIHHVLENAAKLTDTQQSLLTPLGKEASC